MALPSRSRRFTGAALWLCLAAALCACRGKAPAPKEQEPPTGAPSIPAVAALEYLDIPLGGAAKGDQLPLIVALHGLGDDPQSFSGWLRSLNLRARLIVPRAPTPHGTGYSWFPYKSGRTSAELAQGIRTALPQLVALFSTLSARFPGAGKPVVLGFSQGGMLSFALAAQHPDLVKAALPISGALPPELTPASVPKPGALPMVRAFHGDLDRVVPKRAGEDASLRLSKLGYRAELKSFPGVGHTIPAPMREQIFAALRELISN